MKLSTRLTLAMVTLVVPTVAAVGYFAYRNIETVAVPRALAGIEAHAQLLALELEASVRGARADVAGFRSAVALEGIVRATLAGGVDPRDGITAAEWRGRMAARFAAELAAKPAYSQFRIIGAADGGREILRVDRSGPDHSVRVAPDGELQRKGNHDYFVRTLALPAGATDISPIELNRENGAIEVPHTPTLRAAASIHTADGQPFGIVIINVDLRPAFEKVRSAAIDEIERYVVNERGDYLVHPDRAREFGFERGTPYRLQDDFPGLAAALAAHDTRPRITSASGGGEFGVSAAPVRLAGGPLAVVIETVPHTHLTSVATAVRNSALLAGLISVLGATVLAYFLSRSLSKPLTQMTEAVEGYARGEPIDLPVDASGEIGILAKAFAHMTADIRRQTDTLVKEVEERRRIFDTSPDLILVTDRRGIFSAVNPSSKAILGYCPEEMIGRSAIEFVFPGDLEPTRAEMRAARRGRAIRNFESRYVHKDGRVVTLAWSGVWSDPTHQYFFVGRDTSEQRLAEEKFRLAVEASPSGIVMIDSDGKIVLVNAETERMFGYGREELLGQPVDILVPERLRGEHVRHRTGFVNQPETRRMGAGRDLYGRRKNGSEFPVEIGLNPIHTAQGLLVMSAIVDITESQKAQEAIRQEVQERKRVADILHNTITSMVDPVMVADAEGKLLIVNPAAQRIFGRLPGVDTDEYSRPYDRFYPNGVTPFPFEKTALYRAVRGEAIDDLEYIIRPKEAGDGFHLVASGRPIRNEAGELQGAVTVYRDITASKKAQEALLESEQMARAIIDTALDAFLQLDETGTIIDWSPKAEAMLGWSRQDVVGRKLRDVVIPPAHRGDHADRIAQFLRDADNGTPGHRFEAPSLRSDGKEFATEISLTAIRRRGGYIINGFLRDITEVQAREEQLRQSQKMESVGQLTGGIAHDFNNMLTVITGTIDILGEAVADKPELVAITKLISEAADRGAELTGHLLAFARKQPLRPRETDIHDLMTESTKLMRATLGEHIDIEAQLQPDLWPALVDPSQLSAALLNLAINSRDAMPDGGKLTIEARNIALNESYSRSNSDIQPGRYVLIAVSDTGNGIPQSILDKVFEPFFTTKEVGKGTGLGLSMVYGFVKQSGGHIKVYSEVGHGTTFRLYLPQVADVAPDQYVEDPPMSAIAGNNETILIVEDDALVRGSVIAQLQGLGYQTLSAPNAAEALALVDGGAAFDLLFTDVIMPGPMNGRHLAEAMARRRSPLRVVFTSGYTENAIIHHGRLDPGVLLLAKPYRKADLARMVRQALDGSTTFAAAGPAETQKSQAGSAG